VLDIDDLILVSVDDHVVEPPDMFEGRLSGEAAERAPKVVKDGQGRDIWMFEGKPLPNVGLNAVAGRVPEEYGVDPVSFDQMRPGCFDIDERVRDMDVNGVLGSLNFPSIAGFAGQLFMTCDDKDVAIELVRAYNDWHIDEWCGTHPGRMIPCSVPPVWDPQLMADEIRRCAAKGAHAVTFSENPEKLGLPSFHSDHWDPFWKACSDTATVVCLHIGSSSQTVITAMDAPIDTMITLQPMNIVLCAGDLLFSPVLRKFPDLKVALSEGGIGWIPYFLERADYVYKHHAPGRTWTSASACPATCSATRSSPASSTTRWAWRCATTSTSTRCAGSATTPTRTRPGPGRPRRRPATSTACPATRSTRSPTRTPCGPSPTTRSATSRRQEATVGALRARATDVDTTPVAHGTGKFQEEGLVTAVTLAERIAAQTKAS
jgi:hypothetical protein